MPSLLTLTTNLKDLRFGNDRPGGGNSNQPYIKTPIPDQNQQIPSDDLSATDFLLRGGINAARDTADDLIRLGKYFTDLKSPSGLLFTAKQNVLSSIAVKTQASTVGPNEGAYTPLSTLAQAGINFIGGHVDKQGVNPLRGVTTYEDVKDNVVGGPEGGTNRLVVLHDSKISSKAAIVNSKIQGALARASGVSFLNTEILSYGGGPNSTLGVGQTVIKFADQRTGINNPKLFNTGFFPVEVPAVDLNSLDIPNGLLNLGAGILGSPNFDFNPNQNDIPAPPAESGFNVFKRPPITLQKGNILFTTPNTVTQKYRDSVGLGKAPKNLSEGLNASPDAASFMQSPTTVYPNSLPGSPSFEQSKDNPIYNNGSLTMNQEQLNSQLTNRPNKQNPGSEIQDFRKPLIGDKTTSTITNLAPSYNPGEGKTVDGPKTSRVNYVSPGQKGNIIDYSQGKLDPTGNPIGPVDRINALPIYKSGDGGLKTPEQNDLVKFRIGAIRTESPDEKDYINFRAFIDSFSDSYNANWNAQKYMGRGEQFYKYDSFSRDINLSFTVAAQSREEIMIMYRKLNFLASNLAPDYTTAGYMAGPLVQLTMGGWCYELPGFINSLTLEIPQESPWEIGIPNLDRGETSAGGIEFRDPQLKEMPMICRVTGFSFTPIHTFRPAKQTLNDGEGGISPSQAATLQDTNTYGPERYIALSNGENNNYDTNK